jgi:hypothetical protein
VTPDELCDLEPIRFRQRIDTLATQLRAKKLRSRSSNCSTAARSTGSPCPLRGPRPLRSRPHGRERHCRRPVAGRGKRAELGPSRPRDRHRACSCGMGAGAGCGVPVSANMSETATPWEFRVVPSAPRTSQTRRNSAGGCRSGVLDHARAGQLLSAHRSDLHRRGCLEAPA